MSPRLHPHANQRAFSMDKPMSKTFAASLLALAALGAQAQTQLTPQAQRISDRAIQADHQAYEALQGRIKGLNDGGRPVRDYHLAKAQCWLDVSMHEYTRNDRSHFPQEALSESEKLIVLMEQAGHPKPLNGPWDTPLVNQSAKLRPDLWARAEALKQHRGFACATQRTACSEVELVHAGNEINQQQWRHAKPYVQIAEDQLFEAEQLATDCPQPAAPAPVMVAAPAPAAPQPVALQARVVFNFDKHTPGEMRPESRRELEALAAQLKQGVKVTGVKLIGHADRLNSTGKADYNQQLSDKRARTVRDYLVSQGVDASLISMSYRGDTEQVAACSGHYKYPEVLEECLLPNRRVQVELSGVR